MAKKPTKTEIITCLCEAIEFLRVAYQPSLPMSKAQAALGQEIADRALAAAREGGPVSLRRQLVV